MARILARLLKFPNSLSVRLWPFFGVLQRRASLLEWRVVTESRIPDKEACRGQYNPLTPQARVSRATPRLPTPAGPKGPRGATPARSDSSTAPRASPHAL